MSITKRAKMIFGALALTGAVMATGGAFTANGITSPGVPSAAFIGGTVSQTVEAGFELASIDYASNDSGSTLNNVDLVFTGLDAMNKTISLSIVHGGGTATVPCDAGVDSNDDDPLGNTEVSCGGGLLALTGVTSVSVIVDNIS